MLLSVPLRWKYFLHSPHSHTLVESSSELRLINQLKRYNLLLNLLSSLGCNYGPHILHDGNLTFYWIDIILTQSQVRKGNLSISGISLLWPLLQSDILFFSLNYSLRSVLNWLFILYRLYWFDNFRKITYDFYLYLNYLCRNLILYIYMISKIS